MGSILGIGMTDYPCLARDDYVMTFSLRQALLSDKVAAEKKDTSTWPARMREMWEGDEGYAESQEVRASQVEEFRRIKKALDDFEPDAILLVSKDHREALDPWLMVPYWVSAVDRLEMRPWDLLNDSPSVFGQLADTIFEVPGHREIAYEIIAGLWDEGFDPAYVFAETKSLPHAPASAVVHLDWDERKFTTPVILLGISPFGPRDRGMDGMSGREHPNPILPVRAFDLGAAIARTILASSRKVAVVGAAGWSHANNTTSASSWLWPDVEADQKLFERWKQGDLRSIVDLSADELEAHGWWELSIPAVVAGAMSEAGATLEHTSLQTNYLFNSNWVTSIFAPAG